MQQPTTARARRRGPSTGRGNPPRRPAVHAPAETAPPPGPLASHPVPPSGSRAGGSTNVIRTSRGPGSASSTAPASVVSCGGFPWGRRAGWWRTTRPGRRPSAELWRGTSEAGLPTIGLTGFRRRPPSGHLPRGHRDHGESELMLDTHAVARSLTAADFTPAQADAVTDALRLVVEQGEHVTSDQFRAGLAENARRAAHRNRGGTAPKSRTSIRGCRPRSAPRGPPREGYTRNGSWSPSAVNCTLLRNRPARSSMNM